MNKGIIVVGFATVGKTTLSKKYKNVIDLESSPYRWDYSNIGNIPIEKRKGLKNRIENSNWPQNYYDAIKKAQVEYDIVLVQLIPRHLDYFDSHNMKYIIAYPDLNTWKSVEKKCLDRGNNEYFINHLKEVFIPFYIDSKQRNCEKFYSISDNKTLESYLLKDGYKLIRNEK